MTGSLLLLFGALGGFVLYAIIIAAIIFFWQKRSKTTGRINKVPLLITALVCFAALSINRLMYDDFHFDILLALPLVAILFLSYELIKDIRGK